MKLTKDEKLSMAFSHLINHVKIASTMKYEAEDITDDAVDCMLNDVISCWYCGGQYK